MKNLNQIGIFLLLSLIFTACNSSKKEDHSQHENKKEDHSQHDKNKETKNKNKRKTEICQQRGLEIRKSHRILGFSI